MKAIISIKIVALLLFVLCAPHLYANSIVKEKRIESSLSYSQAQKLGFKAEVTSQSVRSGVFEFRIAVPEQVNGERVKTILSEIFSGEHSIALLHMNSYSSKNNSLLSALTNSEAEYQKYFYININPKIIKKTILSVSCENGYVYLIEINVENL